MQIPIIQTQKPDLVFDAWLVQPRFAKETEQQCPLRESRTNNWYLPGAYAWLWIWDKADVLPLYVGKAVRLRNRNAAHWQNGDANRWMEAVIKDWLRNNPDTPILGGMPDARYLLAVWFSENREVLEKQLIKDLQPRFNVQVL